MDKEKLSKLLREVRDGKLDINEALEKLKSLPYENLGFARIDTHRGLRTGFPEVILCLGKTTEQIIAIINKFSETENLVMATRAEADVFEAVQKTLKDAQYFPEAGIILIGKIPKPKSEKIIAVVSAGTSDIPVAEEAAVTAEVMGNKVDRLYDIGVAGVHRLLDNKDRIFKANVVVTVAGMEGALASVVGGMVKCPVIAVPTSIGYGANFHGLSALLSMLNCCSPGVSVVNIDNGFGGGYMAGMINLMSTGGEK